MGHLKFTVNSLLLVFLTITCQSFNLQSQAITRENSEESVNLESIISYPWAKTKDDHRGSGRRG
jgi:hypothetical protein